MSLQLIRQFLAQHTPDIEIIGLNQSTATVDLVAKVHSAEPDQVTKTLSPKVKNDIILIIAKGNTQLDSRKLKSTLGAKARMLSNDEVVNATKHSVDGVYLFGLETPISIYCDVSLKYCAEMLSAAGAICSAVRITPERVTELTSATWVDACQ